MTKIFTQKFKNQAGFTLMELLVVMVILGLVTTVGLGAFRSSQAKSRDARRKAELGQIAKALEVYYNDKGEYPETASIPAGGAVFNDPDNPTTIYMSKMPKDPRNINYTYERLAVNEYALFARLENTMDIDAAKFGSDPGVYSGKTCGSDSCNYVITSVNVDADTEFTIVAD